VGWSGLGELISVEVQHDEDAGPQLRILQPTWAIRQFRIPDRLDEHLLPIPHEAQVRLRFGIEKRMDTVTVKPVEAFQKGVAVLIDSNCGPNKAVTHPEQQVGYDHVWGVMNVDAANLHIRLVQ